MIHTAPWWLFLACAPVIYWNLPSAWRPWALGLGSLALLSIWSRGDLLVMVVLAALVFAGPRLDPDRMPTLLVRAGRSTWPAWLVFGYFIWSKYLPAMALVMGGQGAFLDVAVPLGVSYFSFKLLHYAIETKRGNFPPHDAGDFVSWLFLAPIFTAGPIERFEHFLAERETARFEGRFVVEGGLRITQGLVKKFFVGVLVLEAQQRVSGGGVVQLLGALDTVSPGMIWAFLALTLLYVYLDFSAYSDIAIGSSRLFGLRIMENFNYPFLATSLQGFWQRWHMTLANWCRTYIYMSMIGLTRNPYVAVIATFVVMGLWHAASPHWIAWGFWHGLGMAGILVWQRFAMKRRIKFFKTRAGGIAGWALTMAYVTLGGAFTLLHGLEPVFQSVRLIAAAFGIDL